MADDYPYAFLGHGSGFDDAFAAWVVFREPLPGQNDSLFEGLPAGLRLHDVRTGGGFERVLQVLGDDEFEALYDTRKRAQKLWRSLEEWLAAAHQHQRIRLVVVVDAGEGDDAWDTWSRNRVKKVLLPWFVETWKSAPTFRNRQSASVLAELLSRMLKTRREETIALAARAVEAAIGHDPNVDRRLAGSLATLIDRLSDTQSKARAIAELSPGVRLRVWAHADDLDDLAPTVELVREDVAAIGTAMGFADALARLANRLGSSELHELAVDRPDVKFEAMFEAMGRLKGPALERLATHVPRFATDQYQLSRLLHRALELDLPPIIDRCLEAGVLHRDAPDIVSNLLYGTTQAGRAHQTVVMAADFVRGHRERGGGRMLATLYTNILLAYGATATCDDTSRWVTLELERILDEDPQYFGFSGNRTREIAEGRAGRDILASAYGSAACGRAVMGDGEAAAKWLAKAKQHAWNDLALCANLVCFQHLKDDPHVKPVVAEIARTEVARLEASLKSNSKDPNALFALALTLHNAGFLDDAERYYRRVLERKPRHADALNNLGNIFGVRGDYAAAVSQYDAAIGIAHDHPIYHACKGWALARAGRYQEALETSERAVALAPAQAGGYFPRGAAWLGLGEKSRATADFRRGAELNPGWRGSEKDDPWFADIVASVDSA